MKFKVTHGNDGVEIKHVELTNDDSGELVLIFTFDNLVKMKVPVDLNIDYLTVVKKLVKKRHDT